MNKIAGVFVLALACAISQPAAARVDVSINFSLPPPVVVAEPPRLIVLPETYVYVAPELDVDIFFYEGWWWRTWENRWYRSRSYNSGWIYYEYEPVFYRDIPREWRRWYHERRWREYRWDHRPLSYYDVERNWRDWEERRYWEHETSWHVEGLRPSPSVMVDVNIAAPPPVRFVNPPELVVIPETYVYAVPNLDIDIFFFDGWWWRTWENRWYRSRSYSSGWVYYQHAPVFYRDIPPDWRRFYRERRWRDYSWDYRPIPYREVERNWRDWEHRRYWEKEKRWDIRMRPPGPPPPRVVQPPPHRTVQPPPHKTVQPPPPKYYNKTVPVQLQGYGNPGPPPHKGGNPKYYGPPNGNSHKGKGNKHH